MFFIISDCSVIMIGLCRRFTVFFLLCRMARHLWLSLHPYWKASVAWGGLIGGANILSGTALTILCADEFGPGTTSAVLVCSAGTSLAKGFAYGSTWPATVPWSIGSIVLAPRLYYTVTAGGTQLPHYLCRSGHTFLNHGNKNKSVTKIPRKQF